MLFYERSDEKDQGMSGALCAVEASEMVGSKRFSATSSLAVGLNTRMTRE
jgi:hypothetical protein